MTASSIRDAELGAPHIPTSIALPAELESLAWRKRTIHVFREPQEQYLVIAPDEIFERYGARVLGSGFSEAHAAASAAIGLAYHAQKPSDFCPSLAGYTFKPSVEGASPVVVWNCVDPDGKVKGWARGKREASEDALFALLAARPVSELSADEFARIATPVLVQSGRGRREKSMLLGDEGTGLRSAIGRMYRHAPGLVENGETLDAFRKRVQSSLQDMDLGGGHMLYASIRHANGESEIAFHLVFHTTAVSPGSAIRGTYEIEHAAQLQQFEEDQTAEDVGAPRA